MVRPDKDSNQRYTTIDASTLTIPAMMLFVLLESVFNIENKHQEKTKIFL